MQRQTLVEEPISPEKGLTIFLYRMGRGDCTHTIAELFSVTDSTVCNIVLEVSNLIIEVMWEVAVHLPTTEKDYNSIIDFEKMWQFLYCFGPIDGCYIPIKCLPGSQESAKEYHEFKNFYSILL